MEKLRKMSMKVEGAPGGCVFKKGSDFPNTIILPPMVLIHHFAFNYERLLKKVKDTLEEGCVQVDMDV